MFSCEFCTIFKNSFLTEQLKVTAFDFIYDAKSQKTFRSSYHSCSIKKCARNFTKFTGKQVHQIKKGTLAQVFPCEFYEISKNTFFTEHLCFCTLGNNWPSYPRKPFNLSSYFKQTLQNKPLDKLFSNLTINYRNSFFQLSIVVRELLFLLDEDNILII